MFARVDSGRERWSGGTRIPRHRHARAYAAVVLSGGYEECGSEGRVRVHAGDVLLHGAFDAHLDRFDSGAEILNLPLSGAAFAVPHGRVADADALARLAETDGAAAVASLFEQVRPLPRAARDWAAALAFDLLDGGAERLDDWAARHGLAAATVSRGFARTFGVRPSVFRAEARARRAFAAVVESAAPLATIAAAQGFADQAHMTRAVTALTGTPPGRWRSNGFKTALH